MGAVIPARATEVERNLHRTDGRAQDNHLAPSRADSSGVLPGFEDDGDGIAVPSICVQIMDYWNCGASGKTNCHRGRHLHEQLFSHTRTRTVLQSSRMHSKKIEIIPVLSHTRLQNATHDACERGGQQKCYTQGVLDDKFGYDPADNILPLAKMEPVAHGVHEPAHTATAHKRIKFLCSYEGIEIDVSCAQTGNLALIQIPFGGLAVDVTEAR
ncbi:hypothetical protein C8J57DRAFT_1221468 [Mycena rebaudengoi]|nr:hypothetical protein C8J57DRAFT_1221468 [Mycena rebaudengoi]